jgi:hypothetical protein
MENVPFEKGFFVKIHNLMILVTRGHKNCVHLKKQITSKLLANVKYGYIPSVFIISNDWLIEESRGGGLHCRELISWRNRFLDMELKIFCLLCHSWSGVGLVERHFNEYKYFYLAPQIFGSCL